MLALARSTATAAGLRANCGRLSRNLSTNLSQLLTKDGNATTQCYSSNSPLEGIKVLDLSRILAGPFCTMMLGDLGAEVIKIERPDCGDDVRTWGPPFAEGPNGHRESCYYLSVNRNKKSVTIDFKDPKELEIVRRLALESDVMVENFQPGTLSKYGLDYQSLATENPRLVQCSVTGFGQTGPDSQRGGYDVIAASIGGLMHITGPEDGTPCKTGTAMTDLATGLYAHSAIVTALLHRQKTGLGQHIDCNLLSTSVSLLVNTASNYLNGNQEGKRWGSAHASIVPYQSFQTKDGFFTIGAGNDTLFRELCDVIDRRDLIETSDKFARNEDRVVNREELIEILTQTFKEKTNSEWNRVFTKARVRFPYGPVNSLSAVFSEQQVLHNGMSVEMAHDTLGSVKQVGPAVRFSSIANGPRSPPPTLGQHNHQFKNKN